MSITTGSITVKRLRRGYTIAMHFEMPTGVALYQGVNSAGAVTPDWSKITEDAKRPQVKPVLEATNKQAVTIVAGTAKWKYLDVELAFDAQGACTTSGYTDKFKMLTDGSYTLVIVGNLASKDNDSNDTLTFSCDARCAGAQEQPVSGSIDVIISPLGAGSYVGIVGLTGNLVAESDGVSTGSLNTTSDHIGLTLSLLYGGDAVKFGYLICKADYDLSKNTKNLSVTAASALQEKKDNAIGVNDVDGQTTFVVYFYPEGVTDVTKHVYTVGFDVLDTTDPFKIVYSYADATKQQVDDGESVGLTPAVVQMSTGKLIKIVNDTWEHHIYRLQDNGANFVDVRTVKTKEVTISTSDTDYEVTDKAGNKTTVMCDVDVAGTVQFELDSTSAAS